MVEGILPLVITRETGILTPRTANGVNLVDEDNAGGLLLCLSKQVPHTRSTHTHKHLHKVATANGEEGYIRLARHSLCKQSLTRSGRTYKQCSFGNLTTKVAIFLGLAEEIYNLHNLHLSLLQTGNILEGNLIGVVLIVDLRTRFTHIHNSALSARTARRRAEHQEHQHHKEHHRQPTEQFAPHARGVFPRRHRHLNTILLAHSRKVGAEDVGVADIVDELVFGIGKSFIGRFLAILLQHLFFEPNVSHLVVINLNFAHISRREHLLQCAPSDLLRCSLATHQLHSKQAYKNKAPKPEEPRHWSTPTPWLHRPARWHIGIWIATPHIVHIVFHQTFLFFYSILSPIISNEDSEVLLPQSREMKITARTMGAKIKQAQKAHQKKSYYSSDS